MYVDLRPDETRVVEVLVDGGWLLADLEAYRERDGRWEGWIRWSNAARLTRIVWVDEERIRPVRFAP